jgi:hypothetical protein
LRRVKIFRLGRFLAFPDASSPPRLERDCKEIVECQASHSSCPTHWTHVHYASMSACAPTAESVPLVSSGRACRGGSAGVRKKYDLQLFSIVQTRPACTVERPPKTVSTLPHDARGRLPRLPSCARLVAASQAARSAFLSPPPPLLLLLLLLGCCCRRAEGRRRRPNGRVSGRHRLLWRPHRRRRLRTRCGHRPRCYRRPGSCSGARSSRSSRFTRPGRGHTGEGRNEARTAKGRVRRVEMDAEGWPGLGRWWWPRQGPWWPRGGAQEQRQAAFERPQGAGRRGSTPETRPRSPVKGKPATRRPPAGPRIDYPGPLGWGVRLRGAQARAGPMQGRHRVIHSPTAGRNAAARAVAATPAVAKMAATTAVAKMAATAAAARAAAAAVAPSVWPRRRWPHPW